MFSLCSHGNHALIQVKNLRSVTREMRTRGEILRYAIAFALRGASKLVRVLRQGLSEEERYRVAADVVGRLQRHGDPWRLSEELPDTTGRGFSTPTDQERSS
jgi:hypothetical protein